MSPLLWLQRLFAPKSGDAEDQDGLVPIEEDSPFVWNQHMRIVLAMVVVFVSAMVLWWILV